MKVSKFMSVGLIIFALASCSYTSANEYKYLGKNYIVVEYIGNSGSAGLTPTNCDTRVITQNSDGDWVTSTRYNVDDISDSSNLVRQIPSSKIKTSPSCKVHYDFETREDVRGPPVINIPTDVLNNIPEDDSQQGE
jgi:hypothetical protein